MTSPASALLIAPTDRKIDIDGLRLQVWEGTTSAGKPCAVFVHSIMDIARGDEAWPRQPQGSNK